MQRWFVAVGIWVGVALMMACGGQQTSPSTPSDPALDDPEAVDEEASAVSDGEKAIRAEDFAKARRIFEQIVGRTPNHAKAHHYLAVALEQLGDSVGAEKHYRQAIASSRALTDSVMNLTALLIDATRFREAEEILVKATQQHPGDRDLHLNLAYARLGLGDSKGATDSILQARERSAGDVEVLAQCADLFRRARALDQCVATLTEAIDLRAVGQLYASRALCKQANKDKVGAKADYEKAIALDPNSASAHFQYGQFLLDVEGNKDAAIQEFETCARLAPTSKCKQLADEARKGAK